MTNETKGMLWGLCGVIAFSLTLPLTRAIVDLFDPVFIASGRVVIAAIAAGFWLIITKQAKPTVPQLKQLAVVASGITFGFPIFSSIAMQSLPASHGGVVLGILPIATAIVAAVVYRERPSIAFWLASLAGSVLVVFYSLLQGGGHFQAGDIALLIAAISVSISYAFGATLSRELGGLQVVSWAVVLSAPILLIIALLTMPKEISEVKLWDWASFLYLALVSQWLSFLFWNKGLALGGIARVSQTQLLQPFITIVFAIILLGEHLELLTVVFAVLVAAIVAFSRRLKVT